VDVIATISTTVSGRHSSLPNLPPHDKYCSPGRKIGELGQLSKKYKNLLEEGFAFDFFGG